MKKRGFKRHNKNSLTTVRINGRKPWGDKLFAKFEYSFDAQAQISAGQNIVFSQSPFNVMSLFQSGGFLLPGGTVAANVYAPVGLNYWSSVYQEGRVEAIKLSVEFINQGQTGATTTITMNSTAFQVAIAAEGPSHVSTTEPIVNSAYWAPSVVRKQRWARTSTILGVTSNPRKSLRLFVRCKDLQPDRVERDTACVFNITSPFNPPGTGLTDTVVFSAPLELHRIGWSIATVDNSLIPVGVSQVFAIRLKATIFVHYWNKVPNTQIS